MIKKLLERITRKLIERRVRVMFDKLKEMLSGKKTHITVVTGLVVALMGVLFGPIDLPDPIPDIPKVEWSVFFKLLWEGGALSFLRMGIKKNP